MTASYPFGDVGALGVAADAGVFVRVRAAGVTAGVTLLVDMDGVTRPLFLRPYEGVMRPEIDGVTRPLRDEATEDGREMLPGPTDGGDSLASATKTPHFGGQTK